MNATYMMSIFVEMIKLFDPEKFDKIIDSTVEQARLHFAILKQSYQNERRQI